MNPILCLEDPAAIACATHPVRAAILESLRSPSTAAAVARIIGQTRQNVTYHIRELERAGLVRHVGERHAGTFIEQLYQAVATTFVISARSTWADPQARAQALADEASLGELFEAGERLQRDTAALLDRAVFDGQHIPSASVTTDVRFADEASREGFLHEYVIALTALTRKYAHREGAPYRLLLAAYPAPEDR
jgi:DNA-binding transcriptional ArsR family regulator